MRFSFYPFQGQIMPHLNSHDAIERMQKQTNITIPDNTPLYHTENNYWIADLENGSAIVLPPETEAEGMCMLVEGVDNFEELLLMIENGELSDVAEFDGSDEEWEKACSCGCKH